MSKPLLMPPERCVAEHGEHCQQVRTMVTTVRESDSFLQMVLPLLGAQ